MRARLATTFQSLRVRNYRLFAIGQLTKLIGVWMQFIAQDCLVLELSDNSATALGVVTALQFVPVLLLTLYGGKLADRHDKRRLIIAANVFFSVLALGLGVLVVSGAVTLGWVFVFAALMGVVNAIETPARQAFVSELVPRSLLPNALGLAAATFNSARIIGPALAGLAIAVFDTGPVFLYNAVTLLAPLVALLRMDVSALYRPEAPETPPDARIRDGLRYVWRRDDLLLPIMLILVVGMLGFNFQLTLAVLAKIVFHTGAGRFGLLSTALAAGSLVGALASGGRRSRPSVYVVIGAAIAFGALETLVGFAPTFWTTALLLLPTGFFMIFFAQASNQRLQLGTDAAFRGRVMALFVLVFLGTTPIGAPAIGWLTEHYGPRLGIWLGGLCSMLAGLAALAWQLRRSGARIQLRLRPLPRLYVIAPAEPARAAVTTS
ncbi:MAG: MFS transporter [Micromonosporaceae bacterium]